MIPKIGPSPIHQVPKTCARHPSLLDAHLSIELPKQAWCADVIYVPMRLGFLYSATIMDWFSSHVLAWRLSNMIGADFCAADLEKTIDRQGRLDIFTTGQGRQLTSFTFTTTSRNVGIASPGKGVAAEWTTSSSNGHTATSNTNTSSSMPSTSKAKPLADGFMDRLLQPAAPTSDLQHGTTDKVYAIFETIEKLTA